MICLRHLYLQTKSQWMSLIVMFLNKNSFLEYLRALNIKSMWVKIPSPFGDMTETITILPRQSVSESQKSVVKITGLCILTINILFLSWFLNSDETFPDMHKNERVNLHYNVKDSKVVSLYSPPPSRLMFSTVFLFCVLLSFCLLLVSFFLCICVVLGEIILPLSMPHPHFLPPNFCNTFQSR